MSTPPPSIDRRSNMPFYAQLKQLLRQDIAARGMEPGDRMPGDRELCETYDVSRTVVRQALQELEYEGVIRREKGRGTFVGDPRTSRGFGGALIGTFEDIQSHAGEQRSHTLSRGIVAAPAQVARDLELPEGAEVVHIQRIRELDGVPWALTRTYLPRDIGEPLLDIELEDVSLFGILEGSFGVRFERARRSLEADLADSDVASTLGCATGSAVLVMRSVSFDQTGRPIERFTGFHRGDRSRLNVDVFHSPA
ncbi:GntR family transcriptional regulator [Streptomyces sp. DvalAA-19]|uniref:GntR family transcriptional regulator n=1 Tax=Streptomyces sp. DvalAA-19 TaxID=1839761 RepID=UPI00081B1C01|nr:GntR family transcriptional regulator [Streptomyces sp. DvalAA-19]SCE09042.1 GntR family transcriptional regulator [Streptomyces sp. DvalAA-19]